MTSWSAKGPLVSIVLPTFNGARHLSESLRSCLYQTWQRVELIVVVDGSTDDSRAILAQVHDPRLRVLDRGFNRGLPESLNEGFQVATGDYLTWTSDDNRYHATAIARMAEVLEQRSDVGLVYTGYALIDEAGRRAGEVMARDPATIWKDNPVGACFLYRRSLAEAVGSYRPEKRLIEDYDYWLRASRSFRFAAIDELLYDYREHPLSLTGRLNVLERARESARLKHELGGIGRLDLRLELAGIDAAEAFEAFGAGQWPKVPGLALRAALRQPAYLANHGLWAIAARSLWRSLGGARQDTQP